MGGYDPEAELMSDRRDFRAEMTAARLEVARLQAEVERLTEELTASCDRAEMQQREAERLRRNSSVLHDTIEKIFVEGAKQLARADAAWNDAVEAAASVCDSKSGTPMDVREPEYYTALGYELAAEDIRALKRT